jgi:hypothetical protein
LTSRNCRTDEKKTIVASLEAVRSLQDRASYEFDAVKTYEWAVASPQWLKAHGLQANHLTLVSRESVCERETEKRER